MKNLFKKVIGFVLSSVKALTINLCELSRWQSRNKEGMVMERKTNAAIGRNVGLLFGNNGLLAELFISSSRLHVTGR